ncbi:MAG: hypothetical protein KF888_02755 [Nitrosomonas sp.]|nr:hypothetical protein [Nitrosomonas sp.]
MDATIERIDPRDIATVVIELGSDVKNFYQLENVSKSLRVIDSYANNLFKEIYDLSLLPTEINYFRVNSKPRISFPIDAAWLAVLIAFGSGYSDLKENIPIMIQDAEYIINEIHEDAEDLVQDVKYMIQQIAEDNQDHTKNMENIRNAYAVLRGEDGLRIVEIKRKKGS